MPWPTTDGLKLRAICPCGATAKCDYRKTDFTPLLPLSLPPPAACRTRAGWPSRPAVWACLGSRIRRTSFSSLPMRRANSLLLIPASTNDSSPRPPISVSSETGLLNALRALLRMRADNRIAARQTPSETPPATWQNSGIARHKAPDTSRSPRARRPASRCFRARR
jgi:hypothetical protein